MIAGHDDKPPIPRVVVGRSTRAPTDDELPIITAYIEAYMRDVGVPPFADHDVEGVGLVLFQRPPSPFVDQ